VRQDVARYFRTGTAGSLDPMEVVSAGRAPGIDRDAPNEPVSRHVQGMTHREREHQATRAVAQRPHG